MLTPRKTDQLNTTGNKYGIPIERKLRNSELCDFKYKTKVGQRFNNTAFVLNTARKSMFFLAKTREERAIIMHELNTICSESNEEVDMASVRGDIIQ